MSILTSVHAILFYVYILLWTLTTFSLLIYFKSSKRGVFALVAFLTITLAYIPLHTLLPLNYALFAEGLGIVLFLKIILRSIVILFKKQPKEHRRLKDELEKYRTISKNSSDILLIINQNGILSYVSRSIKKWVGYTALDVQEKGLTLICKSTQYGVLQEGLDLSKQNPNQPYYIPEIILEKRKSSPLYFEAKIIFSPQTKGVEGWIISLRNIQRRKEIQEDLKQHLSMNKLLLECSQTFLTANQQNMNKKITQVLEKLVSESGVQGCVLWQKLDKNISERFMYPAKAAIPKGWRSFNGLKKQKWLYQELSLFKDVKILDIDLLPSSAASEKKALKASGVESALFFPLKGAQKETHDFPLEGVLGIVTNQKYVWSESHIAQLSLFSRMIAVAIERHYSEDQLRILSQAVEQSPSSVIIMDPEGKVEFINQRFQEVTGYKTSDVIGKDSKMFNAPQNDPLIYEGLWKTIIEGSSWQGELLNQKKNGTLFWEHIRVTPIRNPNGSIKHFLSVREDISWRKQYEAALDLKSHYDALTGLPNRTLALDRLEEAISRVDTGNEKEIVVAMVIGLDTFKKVNDTFGYKYGDTLLVEAAERLKNTLSRFEHTIARLGGDEFLVILSDCTKEQAELTAGHINRAFKENFIIQKQSISVTATVGVAFAPTDGNTAQLILQNADSAMHRAKDNGRDTFCFYTEEIHADAVARVRMEGELSQAIERQELELFYQPIINASSCSVRGAEALIRWQNKTLGFVTPVDFIPLAEDIGLIIPIGNWVLETACKQIKLWEDREDAPNYVTVNVSAKQFEQGDFVTRVKETIQKTKIKPSSLYIEVTESLLIAEDNTAIKEDIKELSNMGVRVSLDDFGTGYSSLSYLKQFSFHTLKIDRSFIMDIPENEEDKNLVRAIMLMAHSLHMDVVAEGVETAEQKEFLAEIKCDRYQGYYFSKPLPIHAFESFLKAWDQTKEK